MSCKCVTEVDKLMRAAKGVELDLALTIPLKPGEKSVAYPQIKLRKQMGGRTREILTPTFCPFCGKKYTKRKS